MPKFNFDLAYRVLMLTMLITIGADDIAMPLYRKSKVEDDSCAALSIAKANEATVTTLAAHARTTLALAERAASEEAADHAAIARLIDTQKRVNRAQADFDRRIVISGGIINAR